MANLTSLSLMISWVKIYNQPIERYNDDRANHKDRAIAR